MKRWVILACLLFAALTLAAVGLADPGNGKGKGKKQTRLSGTVVIPDNGSCGNPWATDTTKRTWTIKPNGNGTFRVGRTDHGTFVTLAGQSPGACDTTGKHGSTVLAGIKGKFRGYLRGTVSGGTCTCSQGYAGCKFNFNYASPNKTLKYHHWQDRGTNGSTEVFVGDIANT